MSIDMISTIIGIILVLLGTGFALFVLPANLSESISSKNLMPPLGKRIRDSLSLLLVGIGSLLFGLSLMRTALFILSIFIVIIGIALLKLIKKRIFSASEAIVAILAYLTLVIVGVFSMIRFVKYFK